MERYKKAVLSLLLPLLLVAGGCASNNTVVPTEKEVPFEITSFSFDQHKHPYDAFPEYRISAGDVLDVLFQIRTWEKKDSFKMGIDYAISVRFTHAPELNIDEKVRPDGTISLPYVGSLHVLGKTVEELSKEIRGKYGKILQNPDLYVTVPDYRTSIKELKTDLHTAPRGLSRLVTVRPDGFVTFPMIGDIKVAGRLFPEVNKEMNEKYDKIMEGLHVDLFLEKHSGAKLYVLGQVTRPGVYDIPKPLTVEQALSMAGSYTPGAQLDNIIIVRKNKDKMIATRIDFASGFLKNEKYAFFYLQPDDIVYVPKRRITKVAEIMREIWDIISFRGWSAAFSWELHREPDKNVMPW
jgi:polysaccharide export outer membrane protein